jgi:hypothetical protein
MPKTGTVVAGYRIERELGFGGMGTVYEATQLSLERTVALKVLAGNLGRDDEFRARFRREAMLQAALEHPNIVPVYEAGECDEGLYIVMKLVRGSDLKQLAAEGSLKPERALAILDQAASALDTAHAAGLVHRDVKPQNVLVDEDDHAYLADFGLTKGAGERSLTLTGYYVGSLDYTAPEQVRGEPFGAPSDLYAFAALLYEALTGEVPFPHDTEAALLYAHVSEQPPRPSERRPELPVALDDVLARGLAKRPEERFRSATELVEAARRALASPPAASADGDRRRFGDTIVDPAVLRAAPVVDLPPAGRIPWRTIALASVLVLALGLAGWALGRVTRSGGQAEAAALTLGPISVTFPDAAWRRDAPPVIPGLRLEGAEALASTDPDRPGTLVVGLAPDAQGVGLLPPALKQQLVGRFTHRTVQLEHVQALQYRRLPATAVRSQIDLLLVPVPRGAVAVACLTPRFLRLGQLVADCDSVAATLRLDGMRTLPLGGAGPYAQAVSSVLARLDGERLAVRRQLADAARPAEQAHAAASLAAAFAAAASDVARARPTPFARPSHVALVGALREAQRAYAALAVAARARDRRTYARVSSRVDAAEKKVDVSIRRLERLRLR